MQTPPPDSTWCDGILAARDPAILALSFSSLHVGLNVLATGQGDCAYDTPGTVLFAAAVLGLFALVRCDAASPSRLLVRDAVAILPGIWFQVTAKPSGWYAAVPVEGCDVRTSGYAMALWLLGELLTFGSALGILHRSLRRGGWVTAAALALAAVALQGFTALVTTQLQKVF